MILLSIPIDSKKISPESRLFHHHLAKKINKIIRYIKCSSRSARRFLRMSVERPSQRFTLLMPSVGLTSSLLMICQLHAGEKLAKPRSKPSWASSPTPLVHTTRRNVKRHAQTVQQPLSLWVFYSGCSKSPWPTGVQTDCELMHLSDGLAGVIAWSDLGSKSQTSHACST